MKPLLICLWLGATVAAAALEPVPPGLFHLADPELEVTVWARSPDLFNPTNIDIDAAGRVWVAEGVNYRKHFDRRPEGDRIVVLEDGDGDGRADRSHVFVQEPFLRAPLGVAVIGNRVVVSMTPHLVVYTDVDGDLRFDPQKGDTREVLLSGFNGRNHDHSLHSVTVGPDGKWYFSAGNCGAHFTDKSGKTFRIGSNQGVSWWPKDPQHPDFDPTRIAGEPSDDGRVWVGGFIARMNPDATGVEILAHNLRNSYEHCVTSLGDIFGNDNDDQPACRTFAVLPGANHGFASADGQRAWQADRRPGQSVATATWRQEDPGVAPAGDIYGGGAPTGIVFYENGALGPRWEGTLLSCESARNTIFGYRPERVGAGWKLERFDFLTTNREGRIIGTDFSGGDATARAEETRTLFRPSDIAVGPDGALYISDWLDPRVGGHSDLDESVSGTIYRVAPRGFRPAVPPLDLATREGALEALRSPAVHVRALGAEALRRLPPETGSLPVPEDRWLAARLRFIRGEARVAPLPETDPATIDPADRAAVEAWGLRQAGREEQTWEELAPRLGDPDPLRWSARWAVLAWRLHPPASVPAFQSRALSAALPPEARRAALTAIGFNAGAAAAEAMLQIAAAAEGDVRALALWWLLNNQNHRWKDHGVAAQLRERGLYDPEKIALVEVRLPEPSTPAFSVQDALRLEGDPLRGKAASAKCLICHRIADEGSELGPDLTTWGRTQTTEVILRSIIEPSAEIAHGFGGVEVRTTGGEVIHGLLLQEGDPLIIRSMGGLTQTIPASRVRSREPLRRSLMMDAGQLGVTAQEAADIAAYLRSR